MPDRIPQSATIRAPLQAYLASDHITPATGLTIAITISKNGAAYGNPSLGATNAVEIGSGSYYVDLSGTDTGSTGPLFVKGTSATIDNVILIYDVVAATNAGFTALPAVAAEAAGGLYTRGVGAGQINQDAAGRIDTNTKAWAGTATTLTVGVPDVNMKTITAGIIAAASFAAGALDAVWSTAARVLTAGTNIVLAKGVGVTGFNDPTAAANATELLDQANGVETGVTVRNALRGFTASLLGKLSGAATANILIRNVGDTKTVVNATVDANGNRSAVTLDLT